MSSRNNNCYSVHLFYYPGGQTCQEDFVEFHDNCYFVDPNVDLTYVDAENFCASKNAIISSILVSNQIQT